LSSGDPDKIARAESKLQELDELERELIDAGHARIPVSPEDAATVKDNKASRKIGGVEKRIEQIQKELDLLSMSPEEVQQFLPTLNRNDPDYSYNRYHVLLPPHKKQEMIRTFGTRD